MPAIYNAKLKENIFFYRASEHTTVNKLFILQFRKQQAIENAHLMP